MSELRTYAGQGSAGGKMQVVFPLTFFNDSPIPIVVENIRLVFDIDGRPLRFNATVGKLGTTEDRAFATPFAVLGREVKQLICEFQREQGFAFMIAQYPVKLEALLDDKEKWVELRAFSLNVSEGDAATINKQFLVHDNITEF